MARKVSSEHPRSRKAELARLWQTKHGDLCHAMHDARTYAALLADPSTPPHLSPLLARDLPALHEQIGRLAMEAGPTAFRECWKKSESLVAILAGKSFQAKVRAAVEYVWPAMSELRVVFSARGEFTTQPTVPDFSKAGLRERTRAELQRDPQMAETLASAGGEAVFDKAFRRALVELKLDTLPAAKPGRKSTKSNP